jgi:DNA-binding MarR family transcriptional regulator
VVAITSAGQKIIDDNDAQAAQIVVDIKAKMGEDQYEQLLDLLALLNPYNPS